MSSNSCSWLPSPCHTEVSEEEGVEVNMLPDSPPSPSPSCSFWSCGAMEMLTVKTPPRKSPPQIYKSPSMIKKRLTRTEAFNKGLLLQYYFCNYEEEEDYETSWVGHQPLTPDTWTYSSPEKSASEQRAMRRRRRRGVYTSPGSDKGCSPPRMVAETVRGNTGQHAIQSTSSVGASNEWSVSYPQDLEDPHLRDWKTSHSSGKGLGVPELP